MIPISHRILLILILLPLLKFFQLGTGKGPPLLDDFMGAVAIQGRMPFLTQPSGLVWGSNPVPLTGSPVDALGHWLTKLHLFIVEAK